MSQLEDRYLRIYGEVLTFGSGDCGQLAHGTDSYEDLIVKYPRIVYSLRDKKVCGIACGGLHNAVYTESGQVYTWGCADVGSLGREGDENLPALVEVSLITIAIVLPFSFFVLFRVWQTRPLLGLLAVMVKLSPFRRKE